MQRLQILTTKLQHYMLEVNPIITTINGLQLRYFGILIALGLIFIYLNVRSNFRQNKIRLNKDETLNWLIIVFLYGVIGARIYYVALNTAYYFGKHSKWYEFLSIWRGGFAINGGVLFAAIALWFLSKKVKPSLEQLTDQILPSLFVLQALVGIGSFLNGETYGHPTELITGYVFQFGPASKLYAETAIHPLMLYEAGLCLISYFILNAFRMQRFRDGFVSACALLCYSIIRFFVGLMRVEGLTILGQDESVMFGFFGMLVSLGFVLGKRLYRKLPSATEQFPSTRKWSV